LIESRPAVRVRPGESGLRTSHFLGIVAFPTSGYFTPQLIDYLQQSTSCGVVFKRAHMFTFQAEQKRNDINPDEATRRMDARGELFKLLNSGFGQRIANLMSSNIVNTLENARATLSGFQG
jgi:hypothetical protein